MRRNIQVIEQLNEIRIGPIVVNNESGIDLLFFAFNDLCHRMGMTPIQLLASKTVT